MNFQILLADAGDVSWLSWTVKWWDLNDGWSLLPHCTQGERWEVKFIANELFASAAIQS